MYIFSRFSPSEWENPFPCQEDYEFLENEFNLPNAFWFSVGSIMQQGENCYRFPVIEPMVDNKKLMYMKLFRTMVVHGIKY